MTASHCHCNEMDSAWAGRWTLDEHSTRFDAFEDQAVCEINSLAPLTCRATLIPVRGHKRAPRQVRVERLASF